MYILSMPSVTEQINWDEKLTNYRVLDGIYSLHSKEINRISDELKASSDQIFDDIISQMKPIFKKHKYKISKQDDTRYEAKNRKRTIDINFYSLKNFMDNNTLCKPTIELIPEYEANRIATTKGEYPQYPLTVDMNITSNDFTEELDSVIQDFNYKFDTIRVRIAELKKKKKLGLPVPILSPEITMHEI